MKKTIIFTAIALSTLAALPATARDYQDVRYEQCDRRFDPHVRYSYVSPPSVYYLPNGQVIVERYVIRPKHTKAYRNAYFRPYHKDYGWDEPRHRRHNRHDR